LVSGRQQTSKSSILHLKNKPNQVWKAYGGKIEKKRFPEEITL
jgi:hypothetical protein